VDIYRPLEASERASPVWTVWRTPDTVWFYNSELGAIGVPSLALALEVVESFAARPSMRHCTRPGTICA